MQQFLDDNIYVMDLGNSNTTADVIFELSSLLEKDEVKNKKICLKLGDVNLNQAQLLSIKSLISGINSILSCIDTKSVETEKVALSLGIIVSNISAENTLEVTPADTYKMADEMTKETVENTTESNQPVSDSAYDSTQNDEYYSIVEESEEQTQETEQQHVPEQADIQSENIENNELPDKNSEINSTSEASETNEANEENSEAKTAVNEFENLEIDNNSSENQIQISENKTNEITKKAEVEDELEVIFGKNPAETSIFNSEKESVYEEETEELADIVVPEQAFTKEDIELEGFPTKYIKQTMRSGQVINYEGNLVIIGDCHPGCEITAFGDITVWGVLSGIAHAGSAGNQKAAVRALKMNAIQLRIANCYSRRPDSLNSVYIEKTNSFTPEEARIVNGEIVVFKMND